MSMEKQGYREMLEQLNTMFPDRLTITPKEAALVMGCALNTVYSSMYRKKNPLPYKQMGRNRVVIPITQLARWLV